MNALVEGLNLTHQHDMREKPHLVQQHQADHDHERAPQ